MRAEYPAPRVSSKERNCTLLGPKRPITAGTPLANLAPVKAETRNKTNPIYVLLAEASKTKRRRALGQDICNWAVRNFDLCYSRSDSCIISS